MAVLFDQSIDWQLRTGGAPRKEGFPGESSVREDLEGQIFGQATHGGMEMTRYCEAFRTELQLVLLPGKPMDWLARRGGAPKSSRRRNLQGEVKCNSLDGTEQSKPARLDENRLEC